MRAFRKFALIAALFGATVLGGCTSLIGKQEKKVDPKQYTRFESVVFKKGQEGHSTLYDAFKTEIEAKVADEAEREKVEFELDGTTAHAYVETTDVARFQAGDTDVAKKPYDLEKVLALARPELQEHIKGYNEFATSIYEDKKIDAKEFKQLQKYRNSTIRNILSPENRDPVSQMVLRGLLREVNAQIDFYADNGKKEYFLAAGLVGGQDVGLTSNPQKIDLTEAEIKAKLPTSYARVTEQAKKSGLSEYTPIPTKSQYGDREEELAKAREQWTDITLAEARALVETDKVGLSNVGTRLSPDRFKGYTDGKFENREVAPGATYIQVVTPGTGELSEDVAEAAKYGGKTVE